ncbi:antigen 5 like allergen Cul n 1 isoform X2 [Drosophila busckii]|uniref:antigen 5 like allergen Cul n 1 isoform X2 n=1 Tax=Drosophila busckii TaxID=30019 RepID=UPI00083ED08C|nr:antigen 5 like allergen Cul n 1 isoform X2 [Drosophila busckii]
MLLVYLLLLWLLHLPLVVRSYNYCNHKKKLCDLEHFDHFICKDKDLDTRLLAVLPDTQILRDMIVRFHNVHRDRLASGSVMTSMNKSFPAAARMRELIWDNELGYMARLHASTVSFKHSECRATTRFPLAGECLGLVFPSSEPRSIEELINLTLQKMFDEFEMVDEPEELAKSYHADRDQDVGHFTVMINDRVSRVGCGIAVGNNCIGLNNTMGHCHFLTCHYDFTNVHQSYVYQTGDIGSRCGDWNAKVSSRYTSLCTNTGKIYTQDPAESETKIQSDIY